MPIFTTYTYRIPLYLYISPKGSLSIEFNRISASVAFHVSICFHLSPFLCFNLFLFLHHPLCRMSQGVIGLSDTQPSNTINRNQRNHPIPVKEHTQTKTLSLSLSQRNKNSLFLSLTEKPTHEIKLPTDQ